jgi:hypothetical protein
MNIPQQECWRLPLVSFAKGPIFLKNLALNRACDLKTPGHLRQCRSSLTDETILWKGVKDLTAQ